MKLHSMGVAFDSNKTVFDNLEMKQKQGQNYDTYMSDLRLSIVECRYLI